MLKERQHVVLRETRWLFPNGATAEATAETRTVRVTLNGEDITEQVVDGPEPPPHISPTAAGEDPVD